MKKIFTVLFLFLGLISNAWAGPNTDGWVPAGQGRIDYSGTTVSTSAWTTLLATVGDTDSLALDVFDSSGQTMKIGYSLDGGTTFVTLTLVYPGGLGWRDIKAPKNSLIGIRGVSGSATSGQVIANFFR